MSKQKSWNVFSTTGTITTTNLFWPGAGLKSPLQTQMPIVF
jgi:hypothetical protein